ncbi:hypothetical protein [Lysobacter gummosus]|jgi:hypothetical protein|uniref:Uncharacterized protein n=1 Tax=Lysobacter gummosus TaxID=262324 RepID=A0ABY3X5Y9_9GAMM|nr:hypothetical protein [Lysobacter gummosus]UNP27979.1 hypothetical protein MOV92_15920 [Lysobacter gummosus]
MAFPVHLPPRSHQRRPEEFRYLLMLLDALLENPSGVYRIEATAGMVISNNARLRELLTMLTRAKRLDALFDELADALFPGTEKGQLGILAFTIGGARYAFRFTEEYGPPNFRWRIEPITFSVE